VRTLIQEKTGYSGMMLRWTILYWMGTQPTVKELAVKCGIVYRSILKNNQGGIQKQKSTFPSTL